MATHSTKIGLRVKVESVINRQRDYPIKSGPTTPLIDTNHDSSKSARQESILFSDDTECYLSDEAVSTVEILLNAGLNSSDKSLMLEGRNIF